jgi:Methyltransferase domain
MAGFREDICRCPGIGHVSGFSAEWLARREPYDTRARNPAVLDAVATSLKNIPAIRIADLACGTGSMLRALAPRFAGKQNWRLVDNDLGLLARAIASAPPAGVTANAVALDLSLDLEAALDGPLDVIVTSALLDLVSDAWLERLAVEIAARSLPIYAALSYDGRTEFRPVDPLDRSIVAAVNAHQRTDKGFGPALGPTAVSIAIARFRSLGYSVLHGTSDWAIGTGDRDIQLDILAAWADAAREMGISPSDTIGWLSRRRSFVAAGQSSIRIGHADFWARQIGTR